MLNKVSCPRLFCEKLLSYHTELISAQLLWGSVLLRGVHHKYAKNSLFKNFESALYLTSDPPFFLTLKHGSNLLTEPKKITILGGGGICLIFFQEKFLTIPFSAKLKMGRGFEAQAAHPCPNQIWAHTPPPSRPFLPGRPHRKACKVFPGKFVVIFSRHPLQWGGGGLLNHFVRWNC